LAVEVGTVGAAQVFNIDAAIALVDTGMPAGYAILGTVILCKVYVGMNVFLVVTPAQIQYRDRRQIDLAAAVYYH
jgi:hypothetical protein